MLHFESDYTRGAHEAVLQKLMDINGEHLPGYGMDVHCQRAQAKIRRTSQCPQAEVFFLTGGTQANAVVIDAFLRPYEGVVAAQSGHIATHEAGAVEAAGHKVLPLPHIHGKLQADTLEQYLQQRTADPNRDHMVFAGMVYLSHPSEYGALYTRAELQAIAAVCRAYGLPLYLDGARLGYALCAQGTDVTLPVIAQCCDAFTIGGTKVGALMGEAVVFTQQAPPHFLTLAKQHGALLAKGWLLGAQFDALLTGGLYTAVGRHANAQAARIRRALKANGYSLLLDTPTNQIFVNLPDAELARLGAHVRMSIWEKADAAHTVVRLATSWATQPADVDRLLALLVPQNQTTKEPSS